MEQVFVVTNPKKNAIWVFHTHEAALLCRHEQKLSQENLVGCVIFDDWRNGQPWSEELDSKNSLKLVLEEPAPWKREVGGQNTAG
jgi:hypothetical protein